MALGRNHIWDGDPLGQGPIALVALVEQAPDVTGTMEPVVGAATAEEYVELVQEQIAAFLQAHADRVLLGHDAAKVHWSLHECLKSAQAPHNMLQTLWSFSRESRLHDIMLLDQRCRLVLAGLYSLPRPLEQLAREYCNLELASELSVPERLSAVHAVHEVLCQKAEEFVNHLAPEPQQIPQVSTDGLEIDFDDRRRPVLRGGPTPEELQFDPLEVADAQRIQNRREQVQESVGRFGPLGVGVDVQGAIALHCASKHGMCVDAEIRCSIRRTDL